MARLPRHESFAPALIIGLLLVLPLLLPKGLPLGQYALGVVYGCGSALVVIGLLLVFRSDRIINFAQVQLGALGAVLFFQLVHRLQFVRWARGICPDCLPRNPAAAPVWLQYVNFTLALVVGLATAVLLSLLVFMLVVRRLRNSPPLVATVATLGIAQVLAFGILMLPRAFGEDEIAAAIARPPHDATIRLDPVVFHVGEIATVMAALAVFAGMAVMLRRSKAGIAVRASAENPERAATLGMNGTLVAAMVWMTAGFVSGLAGVLTTMTTGSTSIGGAGPQTLLRVLAAAVIARMSSFPLAILASVGIAVANQGFFRSFGNGILVDVVVFAAVVAVLLLRRSTSGSRVDTEGSSWRAAREVRPIPVQLRKLPSVVKWLRVGAVLAAVVALAFPWIMEPSDTSKGSMTLIFGMVGLSLLLLTGWAGQISLGQFAFAAVGGFVVAVLSGRMGWPILVAVPAASVAGAVVAVVVGLPALRIRGLYLAVTTLGFAVVTTNILLNERYGGALIPSTLDRPVLLGLDTGDERVFYYLTLVLLAGCVAAVSGMRRSRTGRALIACRDNDRAAQSFGINLVRARLEAFAVSGLIAAFAGSIYAYHQQGVLPGNYAPDQSLTMFLMVVAGGLGSIAGPLLGALFVGGLTIFLREGVTVSTAGAALLLLLFVPGGMSQVVYGVRDALLRRVAERHRIVVPSLVADTRVDLTDEFRVPIAPKLLPTGAQAAVARRYRLGSHKPPAAEREFSR
ncbi:MAG TPA: ABC transporter permease [Actinomycetota bacterium]|nr:ABC transporter permease [Actinomycetota bacterium]